MTGGLGPPDSFRIGAGAQEDQGIMEELEPSAPPHQPASERGGWRLS